jgi:hypothetical protein
MSSTHKIKIVSSEELCHNILSEGKGHSTIVLTPTNDIFIWISPQQIAEEASVWDISGSHDSLDLFHVLQLWAEASVHAEDLLVDDGSHGKAVKGISEDLPKLDVISALTCREKGSKEEGLTGGGQTFVIEAIDAVDGGALMVATKDKEVFRIFDLVSQEQADGLQ